MWGDAPDAAARSWVTTVAAPREPKTARTGTEQRASGVCVHLRSAGWIDLSAPVG